MSTLEDDAPGVDTDATASREARVVSLVPAARLDPRGTAPDGTALDGPSVVEVDAPADLASTLATIRPVGVVLTPAAAEDLVAAVEQAAAAAPELDAAVREACDTYDAIAAGCPPAFHPGVGPAARAHLDGMKARLGLDRSTWVAVVDGPPPSGPSRILRALDLEVGAIATAD